MSDPLLEQIYEAGVKDERKKWEERIEQMIAEILMKDMDRVTCGEDALTPLDCVAIIRKYTKEQNNE